MPITPRTRRILFICLLVVLAAMYGAAWFTPAIGLAYNDGAALVQAVTHHVDKYPPLFPWLLGVFALVSRHGQWLKLLPLACTLGWLALTKRLLVKMGASRECSWVLVALTAASPTVLYLGTGLFAEPLFALLATASLLALLDDKPLVAGLCAGLAAITMTAGATLIAASLLTLAHRRFRSAVVFLFASMIFAAPWLGWWLAHGGVPASKLHLSELTVVLGSNAMRLAAAPFTLLSGYANLYPGLLTAVALLIVLVRRRQFVPDLFFGFYCLTLLFRTEPPVQAFAPVLPMFLWILWRVARVGRFSMITKVTAAAMVFPALWFGIAGLTRAASSRSDDWSQMEKLFAFIRGSAGADTVMMADLDPVFYLNTGRRAIRGFQSDGYRSYYAPPGPLVTPDELRASVLRERVNYVIVTPDRDLPESPWFHRAVAAMERGGMLEPVSVPDVSQEYRVLRVIPANRNH